MRHKRGFKRIQTTLDLHNQRTWTRVNQELLRLRQLIKEAADRAEAIGLAYDEFDNLIDEVKRWNVNN